MRRADFVGRTGGVEDERGGVGALAAARFGGVFGCGRGAGEDVLVDGLEEIGSQPLAEAHQDRGLERGGGVKRGQTEEVLEVGVFGDSADEFAVAQVLALLDDQGAEGDAQGDGGAPAAGGEEGGVAGLPLGPGNAVGEAAPFVGGIELHAAGLVEVLEGGLSGRGGFVHGICRGAGVKGGFPRAPAK